MAQLKVFVSGKFSEKAFIREKMDELEELGCRITHDWATYEASSNDMQQKQLMATFDIEGVKKCDIHIVIITDKDYVYRGTFCELGCSLGLDKQVMLLNLVGENAAMAVPFYYHPNVKHFTSWNEILAALEGIRSRVEYNSKILSFMYC